MTAESKLLGCPESHVVVAGELLDALIEAVVLPPDPRVRAAVIVSLVKEMCAALAWRCGSDASLGQATDAELVSVQRLVTAAQDHHIPVCFSGVGVADRDTP